MQLRPQQFARVNRTFVLLGLAGLGFAAGWGTKTRLKVRPADEGRFYPLARGDAGPVRRAEVLARLREFELGYEARDPRRIRAFMRDLFPSDQPVLLTGTDPGEWRESYPAVSAFVARDWEHWGDVRLDVADATVNASGETAWLATVGTVTERNVERPIRFMAVLTRNGDKWQFREVHFQWDERPMRFSELLSGTAFTKLSIR